MFIFDNSLSDIFAVHQRQSLPLPNSLRNTATRHKTYLDGGLEVDEPATHTAITHREEKLWLKDKLPKGAKLRQSSDSSWALPVLGEEEEASTQPHTRATGSTGSLQGAIRGSSGQGLVRRAVLQHCSDGAAETQQRSKASALSWGAAAPLQAQN